MNKHLEQADVENEKSRQEMTSMKEASLSEIVTSNDE